MEKEKIILLGSGQHANVVLYTIEAQGKYEVACILSPEGKEKGHSFNGIDIFGTDDDREAAKAKYGTNKFILGFGSMKMRKKIFNLYVSEGWEPVNVIHPSAIISPYAKLGRGVLVVAGSVIMTKPMIGDNVVIDTAAQVNHDNVIEDHVYIASGVVLSGGVHIEENTLLDDGVIVSLGKRVAHDCIVGAGAVVAKDITTPGKYVGVPAHKRD